MQIEKLIYDEYESSQWWRNFRELFLPNGSYDLSFKWVETRDRLLHDHGLSLVHHDDGSTSIKGEEKDVLFFVMKYS